MPGHQNFGAPILLNLDILLVNPFPCWLGYPKSRKCQKPISEFVKKANSYFKGFLLVRNLKSLGPLGRAGVHFSLDVLIS